MSMLVHFCLCILYKCNRFGAGVRGQKRYWSEIKLNQYRLMYEFFNILLSIVLSSFGELEQQHIDAHWTQNGLLHTANGMLSFSITNDIFRSFFCFFCLPLFIVTSSVYVWYAHAHASLNRNLKITFQSC